MQLGVIATCNSGGAKKWTDEHSEPLRGADAIVIPDADVAGDEHLEVVKRSLTGIAKQVRTLRLPGAKDPFDWIASGGTHDKLLALVDEAVAPPAIEGSLGSEGALGPHRASDARSLCSEPLETCKGEF
jgi:hypothetical protein